MRAVVQRVKRASVTVGDAIVGQIQAGLCVLVGVERGDRDEDARLLAKKLVQLRIFEDVEGKMNLDVRAAGGALLLVSQFTLLADTRRGNRPGFSDAMDPAGAEQLFSACVQACRQLGVAVETGRFRTTMLVSLDNDGPVTILMDTRAERTSGS